MGYDGGGPRAFSEPNGGSPHKRPRILPPPEDHPRCLVTRLPLELLAEILLYTASPRDVLAVARCCKFLCATLLNPSSSYIWKGVRNAFPIPVPAPMSTLTEASYAAFLFDEGPCEHCNEVTDTMYRSFSLRLRLCRSVECMDQFVKNGGLVIPGARRSVLPWEKATLTSAPQKAVYDVLPWVEVNECLVPNNHGANVNRIFRGPDWDSEIIKATSAVDDYIQSNKSNAVFVAEYTEFCRILHEWKQLYHAIFKSNKLANENFAKATASKYGWDLWDLLNCTPYGTLHRLKNKTFGAVTQADYNRIALDIDQVLIKLAENRKRKAQENAFQESRQQVSRQFQRIRSQRSDVIIPPLSTFRQLPIMAAMQGTPSTAQTSSISESFKEGSWVLKRLETELESWREKARADLGATLGYPNWKTASTKILHPVDRVTARFLCKQCSKLPVRYRGDVCFDFAGACLHECSLTKKERRAKIPWSAEKFVRDEKAIAAITKLLCLCGADASLPEAAATMEDLDTTIVCTTCEAGIFMDSKCAVGHSHRHQEMQMKLISKMEADHLRKDPVRHGVVQQLTCPGRPAQVLRGKKSYGCQHCVLLEQTKSALEQGGPSGDQQEPKMQKPDKNGMRLIRPKKKLIASGRRTFDGLRSHLTEKHGIADIRDEDLFLYDPTILDSPES